MARNHIMDDVKACIAGRVAKAPKKDGRMPMLLEAQKRIRDRWGDRVVISKSVAAPFSGLTLL